VCAVFQNSSLTFCILLLGLRSSIEKREVLIKNDFFSVIDFRAGDMTLRIGVDVVSALINFLFSILHRQFESIAG